MMAPVLAWVVAACHSPTGSTDTVRETGAADTSDSTEDSESGDTGADSGEDSDTADSEGAVTCDSTLPWTYVGAGLRQTCGIHADGCAECWGAGEEDDIGPSYDWKGEDRPPVGHYRSIHMLRYSNEAYGFHNCGILEDGSGVCFGGNEYGESDLNPGDYVDLAVQSYATIALGIDGALSFAGLVDGTAPEGAYSRVEADDQHMVLLGMDQSLSDYYQVTELTDARPGPYVAMSISSDPHGICAVTDGGAVECWQDGIEENPYYQAFIAQVPTAGMVDVCLNAIGTTACALGGDGSIQCWSYADSNDPLLLGAPTGTNFVQLACGAVHACGLTTDGEIQCWGYDVYGETIPPS